MRIRNPGVFRAGKVLQAGRRIDAHRGDRSLDSILMTLQVGHGSIALTHAEHADRAFGPRQFPRLDQGVQRVGRSDDGGDARRIVVRALFVQMSEGEHLLGSGAVGSANDAGDVRVDARVVSAVDVGPHLHRSLLQQLAQQL
jgi:hypothetical protein